MVLFRGLRHRFAGEGRGGPVLGIMGNFRHLVLLGDVATLRITYFFDVFPSFVTISPDLTR